MRWFDTMADMVATPGSTNRQVGLLLSYRTIGDGGEGIFYWDQTATDVANSGTIVGAFATGRWKRIYDRNVTVRAAEVAAAMRRSILPPHEEDREARAA